MSTMVQYSLKELAAYGYFDDEIVNPESVRVGLGSNKYLGVNGSEAVVYHVQQIRATESRYPDLAVLVLRNAIDPISPKMRPAMIFMDNLGRMDQETNENFTALAGE